MAKGLVSPRDAGRNKLSEYVTTGKLSKLNLCRFENQLKSKVPQKHKKIQQQFNTEVAVLKRVLFDKVSGDGSHKFKNHMKYALVSHPLSFSDTEPQTQKVILRKGNKAVLMNWLWAKARLSEWPSSIPSGLRERAGSSILNVM